MVSLRNFTTEDATALRAYKFRDLSTTELEDMIMAWNQKQVENRYFEMFAIWQDENLVGTVSLYGLSPEEVSIGPEIFPSYRRNGFAKEAMLQVCEIAKTKGYKRAFQQIRTDNHASIALHTSIGFFSDRTVYTNKKGNQVVYYRKNLI